MFITYQCQQEGSETPSVQGELHGSLHKSTYPQGAGTGVAAEGLLPVSPPGPGYGGAHRLCFQQHPQHCQSNPWKDTHVHV